MTKTALKSVDDYLYYPVQDNLHYQLPALHINHAPALALTFKPDGTSECKLLLLITLKHEETRANNNINYFYPYSNYHNPLNIYIITNPLILKPLAAAPESTDKTLLKVNFIDYKTLKFMAYDQSYQYINYEIAVVIFDIYLTFIDFSYKESQIRIPLLYIFLITFIRLMIMSLWSERIT